MVKKFKTFDPQLVFAEQIAGSAIALTNEAKLSLYKKSQKSGIPTNILETVYYRGYKIWNESFGQTPEQFAFDRVNSFIAGGFAAQLDDDLMEKRGLWDNIHAKRERIKNGSGEHMRKPGSKGAPTADALKNSQNESFGDNYMKQGREYLKLKRAKEKAAKNPQPKMTSMDTDDLVKQYLAKGGTIKKEERTTLSTIKNVIREEAASDSDKLSKFRKDLADNKAKIQIDMAEKGEKHPATQQPADFLSRKRHAEKYTPDGIEKPVKAGDGFGSVQQHLRGTLQQQVQSNQGGKFNIQKNK